MQDNFRSELQVAENIPNVDARFLLTSTDSTAKVLTVDKAILQIKGRKKQDVPYPLRFRSKAERKRIYDAAARMRMSVRDFILDAVTRSAALVLANGTDLREKVS